MLRRAIPATLILVAAALSACVTQQAVDEPRIALQNVRIQKAEGLVQHLQVDLLVSNPNDFDIPLTGLDFTLAINGKEFASGLSNRRVTIPRLADAVVPVEVTVSLVSLFQVLQAARGARSLDYAIAGNIHLDHVMLRTVPFDKTGSLAMRRDGEGVLSPL